jgi:hypothetical protein
MEIDYIRVYQTEGSDSGGGGGGGNPGTTSPTDAPSPPTASAADVISLFSEAYTDVPDTNWTPNWGQSTISSLETIAGNEVRKYTNLNYIGVELDAAQYQDVSGFEKIHFDYWTADASDLSLSLISPGPSENPVSVGAISTGAWQSVDIPLSSYSTPDLSEIFQLKFEGSGTVYIDNVYFYKTGTGSGGGSGGGGNPGAPTPTKASADVISVYSDAYTSIATNINPNWGQATNAAEIQIEGNNTLEYANLNYQGLDYSTTDVSAMEYVHLDYKTDDATALDFYLISENPTVENPYSIDIVTGSWQSIDIPLSVYTANLDRVFQFKTVGDGTVYLDNLYFWKAPTNQSTDASLSDLTVNGSTVTGFSSATTSYTVELPEGSAVPTVTATPTDGNATAVVTDATSLPGNTTVTVTTTGGASQTYTISFVYEAYDSGLSAYDNFEGDGNITTWAEDDTTMDTGFSNPFSTGINSSNTVLRYQDAGGTYANIRFDVSENFDLSSNSLFTLKIYVPTAGITGNQPNQISLKLQDGTLGQPWVTQCEIIKPIDLDQWQEITFDFDKDSYINLDETSPDPMTRSDFNRVVLQVNSENNNDQVVAYLDDFLYNSVLSVKEVVRPISMYPNPVKDKLNISEEFDFVEVYNMTGRKVLKSKSSPLSMESLPKGIYLVRVRSKHKTTSSKIIKE